MIPAGLVVVGVMFNEWQSQRDADRSEQRAVVDREIARDAQREREMHDYLDEMTILLLERNLREAPVGAEVRTVARTRTLATLRSLDGARKGIVLRFLNESSLIERSVEDGPRAEQSNPIVDLAGADLRGSQLAFADLSEADLTDVDLSGSEMNRSDLLGAEMSGADLHNACLRGTLLAHAHIDRTDFTAADLTNANLFQASGWGPVFDDANLSGVNGKDLALVFPEMKGIVIAADTVLENVDPPPTDRSAPPLGVPTPYDRCLLVPGHEPVSAFGSDLP